VGEGKKVGMLLFSMAFLADKIQQAL